MFKAARKWRPPAWSSLTLQSRFMIGLLSAALLVGILFGVILYFHMHSIVIKEVRDRANIMLNQVNSVQSYVRNVLRPTMFEEFRDERFVIEAMSSSYVSKQVMETTQKDTEFLYRRVAENARNPESEANRRELKLIRLFRENPDRSRWEKLVELNGEQYYLCARPVRFTSSCMRCHGEPGAAPEELIKRYGEKRGFFHTDGSVAGLVSIGFPVQQTVQTIKQATLKYLILYIVAVALFILVLNMHFRRVVVFNLKRLTAIFQHNFPEHQSPETVRERENTDEVDSLIQGFEKLTGDLYQAREQLKQYAQNLEDMVEERTRELDMEAKERKADAYLFVHILDALRSSRDNRQLLQKVLGLIGRRLGADRACYFCTQFSSRVYTWPEETICPDLPSDYPAFTSDNPVRYTDDGLFIPAQSQDQVWGVLFLDLRLENRPARISDQILLGFGQQLAIAMENTQAFHSLMHQKELLESIFEGISDPLFLLDRNADIVMANEAAERLKQENESCSKPEQKLFPKPGDGSPNRGVIGPLAARGFNTGQACSSEVHLPGGRSFVISIYPITSPSRPGNLAVCSMRDVTSERRMLRQLRQAEKLSAVGKLASGLAHEINNPLGTILCHTSLLGNQTEDKQAQKDVRVIERHAKRAQKILQDLLDFARPKAAGSGRCSLNSLIRKSVRFFQVQADKKQAELVLELDEQNPEVNCSETVVEQILSNLLLNALEAVPAGGRIRIGSMAEKDRTVLRVEDNGPGIEEEHMEAVFDPFFSTKEVGQGTGLGLAIVYGLVQDANGRIFVENTPGACFTVIFDQQENE